MNERNGVSNNNMQVTVKLFAQLGEIIAPEIKLELPVSADRKTILSVLTENFPLHADTISTCNVAVNQAYIYDSPVELTETSEIAIIPPVSGG